MGLELRGREFIFMKDDGRDVRIKAKEFGL
jgi:hypothetical protein